MGHPSKHFPFEARARERLFAAMKEEKQVLLLSSKVAKKPARDDDNGGCFETGSGSAASSAQEAENGATFTKSYDQRLLQGAQKVVSVTS